VWEENIASTFREKGEEYPEVGREKILRNIHILKT
jgi:hypothetical protein